MQISLHINSTTQTGAYWCLSNQMVFMVHRVLKFVFSFCYFSLFFLIVFFLTFVKRNVKEMLMEMISAVHSQDQMMSCLFPLWMSQKMYLLSLTFDIDTKKIPQKTNEQQVCCSQDHRKHLKLGV